MGKAPVNENHGLIDVFTWGKIRDKGAYLYRITNRNGMEICVTNYGAIVKSLIVPDGEGRLRNVVLGYESLDDYVNDPYYMGALVGRYAGRIAAGSFMLGKERYEVTRGRGGFHHHGGREGFGKKIWTAVPFAEDGRRGVKFSYLSRDGEEGFPGNLYVEAMYTLNDANEWKVQLNATTDRSSVLNLTQHAYFNLSGDASRPVLDHMLQINADRFLPVSEQILPTGELQEVKNSCFDFREPHSIGGRINADDRQLSLADGYDHTWVLKDHNSQILQHAATLTAPSGGIRLDVHTTEPGLHVYTGNALNAYRDYPFNRRTALCLETQHFGDSPNRPDFPSTVLEPGEQFYSETVFRFSQDA